MTKSSHIQIGDFVTPITPAGLWLANVPVDGDYYQERVEVCVFKGKGRVLKTHKVVIDYDEWCEQDRINGFGSHFGVGKIEYTDYLIECSSGIGWGGGVNKIEEDTP